MNVSANDTTKSEPIPLSNPEVLIVDNDPAVADVLQEFLNEEGFVVRSAVDGVAALSRIERKPPHLVLADVMMPRLNGLLLVDEIRRRWSHIDVILMSASESPATVHCPFIQKPFDLDDVMSTILQCPNFNQSAGSNQTLSPGAN